MSTDGYSTLSSSGPPTVKKRFCSFQKEWLHVPEFMDWIAETNDILSAKCHICNSTFTVKHDGIKSLRQHMNGTQHKIRLQASKVSNKFRTYMKRPDTDKKIQVAIAEITETYHAVKHSYSYNSSDCGAKIAPLIFKDSEIAKSLRLGRTKQEKIAENVLLPYSIEMVTDKLKNNQPYSLSTDASNKKYKKMFPVCVTYYDPASARGIQNKMIDLFQDSNESAEAIYNNIISSLEKLNLDVNNMISYGADNAPVNYGCDNSVYQKLSAEKAKAKRTLIKGNCNAHVIHNTAKFCLRMLKYHPEALVLKIYSEFSSSAKNVEELKQFCDLFESDFQEILRHIPVRWLSLFAAIDRILLKWGPLKSYFLSQGEESCDPEIWKYIREQEDGLSDFLTIPECYLYLTHHVMHLISKYIKKLESNVFSPFQLYDLMSDLRKDLEARKEDNFCGIEVKNALKNHTPYDQKRFLEDVHEVYERALEYLCQWFDFETSVFKSLAVLEVKAKKPPTLDECNSIAQLLSLELNSNDMYDELTQLKSFLNLLDTEGLLGMNVWNLFFQTMGSHNVPNLFRLYSAAVIIPTHNAFCERMFSLMFYSWDDNRSRLHNNLVKAELCIKNNFDLSCSEFVEFIKDKKKVLEEVSSSAKYNND